MEENNALSPYRAEERLHKRHHPLNLSSSLGRDLFEESTTKNRIKLRIDETGGWARSLMVELLTLVSSYDPDHLFSSTTCSFLLTTVPPAGDVQNVLHFNFSSIATFSGSSRSFQSL
jgi:hypothetical protein